MSKNPLETQDFEEAFAEIRRQRGVECDHPDAKLIEAGSMFKYRCKICGDDFKEVTPRGGGRRTRVS